MDALKANEVIREQEVFSARARALWIVCRRFI